MRKLLLFLLSLNLFLVSCSSPQRTSAPVPLTPTPIPITPTREQPTPTSTSTPLQVTSTVDSDLMQIPWEDRSIFKKGLVESQQQVLGKLPGASVYHLAFNIADDLYHVTGHEEVQYTNTEKVALDEIQMRLFPNILGGRMDVSNIRIDDQAITPKYDLENSLLILPFPTPLQIDQSVLINMDFAVTVPQSADEGYGVLAYYDDVLALAHAYPMICVYNDEGWNAEIPPAYGDVTFGDASFFIVKVTAPEGLTLVTSGSDVSHSESGGSQTLVVANGPARDFYLAASPKYEELTEQSGEITIHSYAKSDAKAGSELALRVATKALEDFSSDYAPYPYTEFDVVATPTNAGGIEYPGLIVATSHSYDLKSDQGGNSTAVILESVVAHEAGHQWFYNLVGDDQLDHPWLDESFAQFATLQYFRDEYGASGAAGFQNSLEGRWQRVERAHIPIGLPVASYSEGEYGAIVYGRGPLFLVALEGQMGEASFSEFMKDYTTQLSWGIATPEFMQSLAEKHCACDLDSLFKEWVYP